MTSTVTFNTMLDTVFNTRSLNPVGVLVTRVALQYQVRLFSLRLLTIVFAAFAGALALNVKFIFPTANLALPAFVGGQPCTCLETKTVIYPEFVGGVLTRSIELAPNAAVAGFLAIFVRFAIASTIR